MSRDCRTGRFCPPGVSLAGTGHQTKSELWIISRTIFFFLNFRNLFFRLSVDDFACAESFQYWSFFTDWRGKGLAEGR